MKRVRDRIFSPNTIARCSLLSLLLLYRCKNISGPWVVGIRALAMHLTMGRSVSGSVFSVKGAADWNVVPPVIVPFFICAYCMKYAKIVLLYFLGVKKKTSSSDSNIAIIIWILVTL